MQIHYAVLHTCAPAAPGTTATCWARAAAGGQACMTNERLCCSPPTALAAVEAVDSATGKACQGTTLPTMTKAEIQKVGISAGAR